MTRPHPETNQHLLMSYSSLSLNLSTQFSCFFPCSDLILSRCCFESLTETVLVSSSPHPSTRAPRPTADDLYTVFSTKQKKREKAWALNQAAKMANVTPNKSPRDSSVSHPVTYRVTPSLSWDTDLRPAKMKNIPFLRISCATHNRQTPTQWNKGEKHRKSSARLVQKSATTVVFIILTVTQPTCTS